MDDRRFHGGGGLEIGASGVQIALLDFGEAESEPAVAEPAIQSDAGFKGGPGVADAVLRAQDEAAQGMRAGIVRGEGQAFFDGRAGRFVMALREFQLGQAGPCKAVVRGQFGGAECRQSRGFQFARRLKIITLGQRLGDRFDRVQPPIRRGPEQHGRDHSIK